jgi:gamma-glutamyltranspeptidase/glutathione hydrolase
MSRVLSVLQFFSLTVWRATAVAAVCALTVLPALPVGAASRSPAFSRDGMVVTSQTHATHAGLEMLRRGGNAVDAAVASAFALSVTQPYSSGIGGGAFILIRKTDGQVVAIDCRETAPSGADRDMYVRPGVSKRASVSGPLAVATPGLVAGLALALEQHGTLTLVEAMMPAVRLAQDGFEIGPRHARMIEFMRKRGLEKGYPETAAIQFPPKGQVAEPGWRLVQPQLALTLARIAKEGPSVFYDGSIGHAIAADMARRGGLIVRQDLADYQPKVREAVHGTYRGYDIYSFPPPSSGGIALVESLNILEGLDLAKYGPGSSASIHRIAESLKLAFADRAAFLGDSDFVDVPQQKLISKRYAKRLRKRINPAWWRRAPWKWAAGEIAMKLRGPGLPVNDSGTTHLSVTDAAGNAVAITKTINTPYGSGVTIAGTGILMNNEMDDFAKAPNAPNAYGLIDTRGMNAIAPLKRPLSSMTPTIVAKDGRTVFVTGSPGGPRIISTTLLTILNHLDYGMDPQAAVSAPRFHHQWIPDKLMVEPATPDDVVEALRERGHTVEVSTRDWSSAEAIAIDPATGWHTGGSDPRRDGLALGP